MGASHWLAHGGRRRRADVLLRPQPGLLAVELVELRGRGRHRGGLRAADRRHPLHLDRRPHLPGEQGDLPRRRPQLRPDRGRLRQPRHRRRRVVGAGLDRRLRPHARQPVPARGGDHRLLRQRALGHLHLRRRGVVGPRAHVQERGDQRAVGAADRRAAQPAGGRQPLARAGDHRLDVVHPQRPDQLLRAGQRRPHRLVRQQRPDRVELQPGPGHRRRGGGLPRHRGPRGAEHRPPARRRGGRLARPGGLGAADRVLRRAHRRMRRQRQAVQGRLHALPPGPGRGHRQRLPRLRPDPGGQHLEPRPRQPQPARRALVGRRHHGPPERQGLAHPGLRPERAPCRGLIPAARIGLHLDADVVGGSHGMTACGRSEGDL
ncbi:hypothetical protein SBRY_120015 [Actinacidiphila bryophytorum]|uniref:Uncharacterized protein n=1 Tax=Actinacidiphila bryophytorum TaxID=1436133 RepID=A0A9W4E444_9ACTN|nr:hypothetical protein SBRY_120015 [Actinacidiphila bryophytorum]